MAIVIPHVFQDNVNESASGVQLNENFNVLKAAAEALETAVTALQARVSHYFATLGLTGNVITGSEQTVTLAANTLVTWSAHIHGAASAGTSGFYTVRLWRDAENVLTHTVLLCNNNAGENGNTEVLQYLQAGAGSHAWHVTLDWGGTSFAGIVDAGMLAFTP